MRNNRHPTISLILLILLSLLALPALHIQAQGPDPGGQIVFHSDRDGNTEIYVMDADGSNPIRLTNNPAYDEHPAWSPDGTQIAFDSTRDGNWESYIMNADGSGLINLTNNSADDAYPAWSPDGSQIVFTSARDNNWEIYIMDADGSNQTRLTTELAHDYEPVFSPDGTQIVFQSERDGNWEIYVMDVDGSNPTNLTNNPAYDAYPAWSPDGTQIAFVSQRDGNFEIYVMDADGSNPTNLTSHGGYDDYPAWSPTGGQIVFQSQRDGNPEIYVMDADGSHQIRLTNNPAADYYPAWYSDMSNCRASTPATAYQGETFTLILQCAGITANVFGFQAGHTITAGDTLVTAQASTYTAGTVFEGQSVLEGSNTLDMYALSLQAGGTEATGDFTLGSVDYSADFPGETTFDLINLILGDINGDAIPDVQASPSSTRITIIDIVDTLNGVVDPEGHALDTELVFALEGDPTIGPIDTTYNPDGTTSFTIHDIHGHPAHLDVDAPSHLTCREPLALSGDETDVTLLDDLILRAGDVNSDEVIDITDAVAIGLAYGDPASGELDINNDGIVNILDLIHIGRNYGTSGPTDCLP